MKQATAVEDARRPLAIGDRIEMYVGRGHTITLTRRPTDYRVATTDLAGRANDMWTGNVDTETAARFMATAAAQTFHVAGIETSFKVIRAPKRVATLAKTERGHKVHRVTNIRPGRTDCDRTEQITETIGEVPFGQGEQAHDEAILALSIRPVQLCAHCFPTDVRNRIGARMVAARAQLVKVA